MTERRAVFPARDLEVRDLEVRGWAARVLVGLFALALVLAAPAAEAKSEAKTAFGHGVLWRVDRPGVPPSYVFGTIHLADPRVIKLPKPVAAAVDQARKLAVEVVPGPDTSIKMARAMALANGRSLDDIVGGDLFLKLIVVADGYGVPEATLKRLKPWAAMMLISIPREEQARRGAGALALDLVLEARAKERGIPVIGLEKFEDQIAVFDGFPETDQVALLRQVVDTHGEIVALSDEMVRYYLSRDLGGLVDWMARQSAGEDPRLRRLFSDQLLVQRNRVMTERAIPLMNEGGAFIAVGAGHLPGKDGLLSMLAARGYAATRVY
jgi:uncharacterized protein YbaP (TraB family)